MIMSTLETSYVGVFYGDGEQEPTNWKRGQRIARSGSTVVYLVIDDGKLLDTQCAVKQLCLSDDHNDEHTTSSIPAEIKALSKVKHPRILEYYGYSRAANVVSIFNAYIEKGSLTNYIKAQKDRHLTERQTSKFTFQILEGLEYLHQQRIIHRDIKGSNILMQDEDNIKISDFGVAKILNTLSRATTVGKGTFNWIAPEAIRRETHNNKVDIWSLGCTVYQMFVGKIPFHEEEDYAITLKAYRKELALTPPENCSKHLRRFLKCTCNIDPSKRPSASELLEHSFSKVFQSCTFTNESDTDSSEDEQSSYKEVAQETKLSFPERLVQLQQTINLGVPITNWPVMFQGANSHIENDRYLSCKIPEYYAIQYASTIGENWEHLFPQLDFTQEETAQELSDCSNDVKQTITNLLIKWVRREGENATHKKLEAAMKKAEESNQLKVDWGEFLYILLDFKDNKKKEI